MYRDAWAFSSIVYEVHMICCRFCFRVLNLLEVREIKKKKSEKYNYKLFINCETPVMLPVFRLTGKSKGHAFNNIV